MAFVTVLAVIGLVVSAFLVGFTVAGLHEQAIDDDGSGADIGARMRGPLLRQGVVLVGTALILVDPVVIEPLWLQYLLLVAVPMALGYVARRVLANRLAARGPVAGS